MSNATGSQSTHDLKLAAPIDRWDEAIPLGNGLMGVLLWGGEHTLKLSLDRGDLWDLRPADEFRGEQWNWRTLKQLVDDQEHEKLVELFEQPYRRPYPTKIPAGRLELDMRTFGDIQGFELDIKKAIGRVKLTHGHVEVFCSAIEPVGMIHMVSDRESGVMPEGVTGVTGVTMVNPFAMPHENEMDANTSAGDLGRLGYPMPQSGQEGDIQWSIQTCSEGFKYAIVTGSRTTRDGTLIAFTITTTNDDPDPVALGRQRVCRALETGYTQLQKDHLAWWEQFGSQSSVKLPDESIEQHYNLVQYFYGAASRRGAPPMPLQGVWTADEGTLPPWKGDYHHDLNTQLNYWAYLSAGHMDEGLSFLEFMSNLLPTFQRYAREFYDVPGACVPSVMTLDGKQMGGWHQYSYSPTNGAWVAHTFYMHWRYTMDKDFLRERAYPFCQQIAQALEAMLQPDVNGKLKLSLSSSPEMHDNKLNAWMTPNTNYDLSLLRWLFGALTEMANALSDDGAAAHWREVLERLDDLAVAKTDFTGQPGVGALMLSPDETLTESHRHFSHLMAIHPLGTVNIEDSKQGKEVIYQSFRQLDHLGVQFWVGYSFSWMACLAARGGYADRALNMLELYLKTCVSRNGFHFNGDFKQLGLLSAHYRPFTLEGNFAAAQAVHEMLLQSWGGTVRIFPAVPKSWQDVAFENLRTEGAFRVSAQRKEGKTIEARITATCDGLLRLQNPFTDDAVSWNQPAQLKEGHYHFQLKAGDTVEACCKN